MFLFAFLDLSVQNILTNRDNALIYSVTICEQKTKDCAQSGSFQRKLHHRYFKTLMFAGVPNQSPLLTMAKGINFLRQMADWCIVQLAGAPNGNFRENICSEDDLRTRIFGTFVAKFLACLPLLGFSNIYKMV